MLEFADGGDMYDHIMKHEGGLEEGTARKYFKQIVTGMNIFHYSKNFYFEISILE